MQICCIDPSGQSAMHPDSPFCVFSCVIIPDHEYRTLQTLCDLHMEDSNLVPPHYKKDFEFHAGELFPQNSTKYKRWPLAGRRGALEAGLRIVADLDFPIRYSLVDKSMHKKKYGRGAYDPMEWSFSVCLEQVEKWFLDNKPDDLGIVITDHCGNRKEEKRLDDLYQEYLRGNFPHSPIKADHLMDVLNFADSKYSRGVQMSDLCSYVIGRHFQKKVDVKALYRIISGNCRGRRLPHGACSAFSRP